MCRTDWGSQQQLCEVCVYTQENQTCYTYGQKVPQNPHAKKRSFSTFFGATNKPQKGISTYLLELKNALNDLFKDKEAAQGYAK